MRWKVVSNFTVQSDHSRYIGTIVWYLPPKHLGAQIDDAFPGGDISLSERGKYMPVGLRHPTFEIPRDKSPSNAYLQEGRVLEPILS